MYLNSSKTKLNSYLVDSSSLYLNSAKTELNTKEVKMELETWKATDGCNNLVGATTAG